MRRDAFKTYLMTAYAGKTGGPLPEASASSYCTYVAQAERLLGWSIDEMDPSEPELVSVISALRSAAHRGDVPATTLNNIQSGVRAYAGYLHYTRGR